MTKQLIALAIAAAFGIAYAADAKPTHDSKPAALKVAADTSNKAGPDAATGKSPEMKTDNATTHKKTRKSKKTESQGDVNKAEPATPATPAAPATSGSSATPATPATPAQPAKK